MKILQGKVNVEHSEEPENSESREFFGSQLALPARARTIAEILEICGESGAPYQGTSK